ncbi:fimbrial biogenesis chaperone [Inquilinus limosus]|uniref:fimbrial biogenesis chaperone n=1 Tax=Inquilinus limosus TaxID=171674 RepID=UPI00041BD95D|nr:molecular chaperone [Inquilinus limosus]
MRKLLALLAVVPGLVFATDGRAASLQVSPVSVDLTAPAQASSVNLRNNGDRPVNVQIRVYKWTQSGGEDQLTPARDVVASPPAAALQPGTTYTIRVARTAAPVTSGEDSYRLLIDELPEVNVRRPAGSVNLVIRYSIPVFFADRAAGAELRWDVRRDGGSLVVEATNTGSRHAKIANLTVASPAGQVAFGQGLNGYVLPGATRRWTAPGARIQPGSGVTITAKGDDYAVNQTATVR